MVDISDSKWSVTDASNTQSPPNGWPSSTAPNQVRGIEQAMMGAIKRLYERSGPVITTTGSANAYVYTPTNSSYPTAYVQGDFYVAIANFSNTGASTFQVNANSLTAKNILKNSSSGLTALTGGEIQNGAAMILHYDGTQFELINPPSTGAPLASPTFTGTPSAPTAAVNTSTTQLATTAFANPASNLTGSGSCKLANGLILNWGRATAGGGGSLAVLFDTAYASACYACVAIPSGEGSLQKIGMQISTPSTTGFTAYIGDITTTTGAPDSFDWIAIGK